MEGMGNRKSRQSQCLSYTALAISHSLHPYSLCGPAITLSGAVQCNDATATPSRWGLHPDLRKECLERIDGALHAGIIDIQMGY